MDQEKNMNLAISELCPSDEQEGVRVVHQEVETRLVESANMGMSATLQFMSPIPIRQKRPRGRPRGSGKLQRLGSIGGLHAETAGRSFSIHVLAVHPGQDIMSRILEFSQRIHKTISVLSASGPVSSVVLRQDDSSSAYMHFEGTFEIITLAASLTYDETSEKNHKNGTFKVMLAKPDCSVFGGVVVGPLIAHSPVQIILGAFKQNIRRELKKVKKAEKSPIAESIVNPEENSKAIVLVNENDEDIFAFSDNINSPPIS